MSTNTAEGLGPLTQEEADIFRRRLAMAREQLQQIDTDIERELAEVRVRIAALQEKREASLRVYDAACTMLGIENELSGGSNNNEPEVG